MFRKVLLAATLIGLGFSGALYAQQPKEPIKRTVLQRADIPGTNQEIVLALAELAPGVNIGRHTHPGPEVSTVSQGELTLLIDGQPAKSYKAGDSFQIPTGTIHDAKAGAGAAKVIAVYIVPKGQPLATPAK